MALKPQQVTVVIDSREQMPYDLAPLGAAPGTLATGDYSVQGLEDLVCLERKSLDDLLGCIGTSRERFERELQRMKAYPHRVVLVEASWTDVEGGEWRSRITPKAACHTLVSWTARFAVPFHFAGSRDAAERYAQYFLNSCAKRHWERAQAFVTKVERTELGPQARAS